MVDVSPETTGTLLVKDGTAGAPPPCFIHFGVSIFVKLMAYKHSCFGTSRTDVAVQLQMFTRDSSARRPRWDQIDKLN
jgi:hypothetical protein